MLDIRTGVEQVVAAGFAGGAEDLVTTITWTYDGVDGLVQEQSPEAGQGSEENRVSVTATIRYASDADDRLVSETLERPGDQHRHNRYEH